jgi:adenosylcobinamide kinase/adenosylcobinamide-phosphate guanylyltransferase
VDVVILDCITLLVSNVILGGRRLSEEDFDSVDEKVAWPRVEMEIDGLLRAFQESRVPWIVVSNEVGWGLVPPYPLGRLYRDLLGWFNQSLAAVAERVYLMVAGLPVNVKALSEEGPSPS